MFGFRTNYISNIILNKTHIREDDREITSRKIKFFFFVNIPLERQSFSISTVIKFERVMYTYSSAKMDLLFFNKAVYSI